MSGCSYEAMSLQTFRSYCTYVQRTTLRRVTNLSTAYCPQGSRRLGVGSRCAVTFSEGESLLLVVYMANIGHIKINSK